MSIPQRLLSNYPVSTFVLLIFVLLFTGCAGPQKHVVHLKPHPLGEEGPSTALVVGVMPFEDSRPSPEVLGKRVLSDGEEDILLDSPSASEDVTYILRRSLKARGIKVVELSSWQPDPEHLEDLPENVNIAIAGRIEALEVEAHSSLMKTSVKYRVALSAKLGYKDQGKVVTQTIETRPEETFVRFDRDKIEESLNESLALALNHLIKPIFSGSP